MYENAKEKREKPTTQPYKNDSSGDKIILGATPKTIYWAVGSTYCKSLFTEGFLSVQTITREISTNRTAKRSSLVLILICDLHQRGECVADKIRTWVG